MVGAAFSLYMGRKNRRLRTSPSITAAASDGYPRLVPTNDKKEYVAGHGFSYGVSAETLSPEIYDPSSCTIDFDTLRLMGNDPEVISSLRTLRDMILADGVDISPGFQGRSVGDESPEYARALEISEFCQRAIANLKKPFEDTLEELLEGSLQYGHKVAEKVFEMGKGQDSGKLVYRRIAIKSHKTIDFVVNRFWEIVGFKTRVPGPGLSARSVIPREKFVVLSMHVENEDPRGRSHLRSAHTAWQFKLMSWPEYYRWLCACALPVLVGELAPKQPGDVPRSQGGTPIPGAKAVSPAEAMASAMAELKNAGYIVIPNGAKVEQIEVAGDGAGFERSINVSDSQIGKGILYQTLASGEAQFGTRAQSETHMSVLDMLVTELKKKVVMTILSDVIIPLVEYNYGEDALPYSPVVSLGDSDRRDWAEDGAVVVDLEPKLTDSQWRQVCTEIGIQPAQPGEKTRGEVREENMTKMMKPADPGGGPSNA